MDDPETKLEPKLQVQNTRPLIDPLPELRNYRDVKLKDSVFYTNEAPRRVEVMGRQGKTTNISAHELKSEDSAVDNEEDEPTVEEKQTDVVTSSLSLLLFSIMMPSLDISTTTSPSWDCSTSNSWKKRKKSLRPKTVIRIKHRNRLFQYLVIAVKEGVDPKFNC